jgi:hypothetical protein
MSVAMLPPHVASLHTGYRASVSSTLLSRRHNADLLRRARAQHFPDDDLDILVEGIGNVIGRSTEKPSSS